MTGNVWEWCLTEYESGSNDLNRTNVCVLRGGSWYYNGAEFFRVSGRNGYDPDDWSDGVGFRLALSL
jgi:formylglycine-generating enzyme required for sulfatase activity